MEGSDCSVKTVTDLIRAVGQPGIPGVGISKSIARGKDPLVETVGQFTPNRASHSPKTDQQIHFPQERKCRDTAQDQGRHEATYDSSVR